MPSYEVYLQSVPLCLVCMRSVFVACGANTWNSRFCIFYVAAVATAAAAAAAVPNVISVAFQWALVYICVVRWGIVPTFLFNTEHDWPVWSFVSQFHVAYSRPVTCVLQALSWKLNICSVGRVYVYPLVCTSHDGCSCMWAGESVCEHQLQILGLSHSVWILIIFVFPKQLRFKGPLQC